MGETWLFLLLCATPLVQPNDLGSQVTYRGEELNTIPSNLTTNRFSHRENAVNGSGLTSGIKIRRGRSTKDELDKATNETRAAEDEKDEAFRLQGIAQKEFDVANATYLNASKEYSKLLEEIREAGDIVKGAQNASDAAEGKFNASTYELKTATDEHKTAHEEWKKLDGQRKKAEAAYTHEENERQKAEEAVTGPKKNKKSAEDKKKGLERALRRLNFELDQNKEELDKADKAKKEKDTALTNFEKYNELETKEIDANQALKGIREEMTKNAEELYKLKQDLATVKINGVLAHMTNQKDLDEIKGLNAKEAIILWEKKIAAIEKPRKPEDVIAVDDMKAQRNFLEDLNDLFPSETVDSLIKNRGAKIGEFIQKIREKGKLLTQNILKVEKEDIALKKVEKQFTTLEDTTGKIRETIKKEGEKADKNKEAIDKALKDKTDEDTRLNGEINQNQIKTKNLKSLVDGLQIIVDLLGERATAQEGKENAAKTEWDTAAALVKECNDKTMSPAITRMDAANAQKDTYEREMNNEKTKTKKARDDLVLKNGQKDEKKQTMEDAKLEMDKKQGTLDDRTAEFGVKRKAYEKAKAKMDELEAQKKTEDNATKAQTARLGLGMSIMGGCLGLAVVGGLIVFLILRRKKKQKETKDESEDGAKLDTNVSK